MLYQMALINSGFTFDEPNELTTPLEKLIRVGFGVDRDEPVVDLEVEVDEEPEIETETLSETADNHIGDEL